MESGIPPYDASEFLTSWNKVDLKGRGSFGCARKCVHSKLGNVVVKCFNITGSEEKCNEAMKEVEREVNVLFRLDHKNIVQMLGVTRWENNIGIIMECVDGGNLEDFLFSKDVPDIPLLLKLRFFHDIADGLSYMHYYDTTKAFVHSDLKPQNILLTPDLMIKIADFGSVNVAMQSVGATPSLAVSCSIQHTVFYAAPEVLKDIMIKKKPSMDVYSFAMVGYEILTRHPVFQDVNYNRAVQAIIDLGQKPDVRKLSDVEKSLEDKPQDLRIFKFLENIIKKCWEYEAEDRSDIHAVRNQTNKELRSLAASTHSYHITSLKSQSNASDKQLTAEKTQLNKFHSPFEEAPTTPIPNTEISTSTKDVSAISLEEVPTQPSKKAPAVQPQKKLPLPGNVQHLEKSDEQQTRFALAENDQMNTGYETLIQQIKQFSTKEKWNEAYGLQLLSLWVQLHELNESSLLKQAAEYFPSKLDLSFIDLNENQVLAISGVLRFTNKFIKWINLTDCQLCTSLFRHFSTALLESESIIGELHINNNQLDITEILKIISKVRDELNLWYSFSDGRGGDRNAIKDERKRIVDVLDECNTSLNVYVGDTTLRSQR